jgi:hypothetical protein
MMKSNSILVALLCLFASGCGDKAATENKAREEADAKVRADAAKKEMKTLPETFKPRYNRKLDQSETKEAVPPKSADTKSP